MNILLLVAILGWYPFVALMMNIFNIKQYKYPYIKNNFAYLGLSLFSILLIFVKLNLALIAVDLYLAPKSFQEQQERITAINEEKMKGNKDITLAPLIQKQHELFLIMILIGLTVRLQSTLASSLFGLKKLHINK